MDGNRSNFLDNFLLVDFHKETEPVQGDKSKIQIRKF